MYLFFVERFREKANVFFFLAFIVNIFGTIEKSSKSKAACGLNIAHLLIINS
jgi:hypothetical protein